MGHAREFLENGTFEYLPEIEYSQIDNIIIIFHGCPDQPIWFLYDEGEYDLGSMEYNKSYHPDTVNVQNESEGFISKANISISSNTMTFRHANYIDMFMLFDTDEFITISTPVNGNSNQNEYDFCIYEEYANLSVVGEDNFAFDLIFDGPDGVNS